MGEASEIIKRISFMVEVYIPRLDKMLLWLRSEIQQLPISSENSPSHVEPEDIEFLLKYVTVLEKELSLLQRSQSHCRYSMDAVIRWEKRLVGNMNMPNLMAAFKLPGDQLSLLQIPQLKHHGSNQNNTLIDQKSMLTSLMKAGTPLQSTNLPSYTLSSCATLASSDLPASADTMSSRGTNVGEQTEITNKINFMKEAYLPPLDKMLSLLACRIPQLPISSEIFPSHLKPAEIKYLQVYKTKLEKIQIVRYLNMPNLMAAVQLPGDLLSQLQIPQLKQYESNQNNPEKSVSTITPVERLTSSSKALSAAFDDIRSVVSMTDIFAGAHPGEGGARSFFHENLASTTRCHVERRDFKVINGVMENELNQRYSVESSLNALPLDYNESNGCKKVIGFESSEEPKSAATSGIKKSRLEVNHILLEEVREINDVLINTKLSINDESITMLSDAGEDVEGMIVNCTFSPVSRSSSTEKFPALPMWFLIPAHYPLCSPVLLDSSLSPSPDYAYEHLLTEATIKFYQSLCWIPELTSLKEMAESWDSCANEVFSEYARRMEVS
ncbi:hypothetical protein MKX01_003439 [Papaver californicum]|nr:hypothetical protein MKX01_003439 [Papaver californicum]